MQPRTVGRARARTGARCAGCLDPRCDPRDETERLDARLIDRAAAVEHEHGAQQR